MRRGEWVWFLGTIIKQLERRVALLEGELTVQAGRHAEQFSSERQRHAELAARQSDEIAAECAKRLETVAALEHQIERERREAAEADREQAEQIDLLERKLAATVAELAGVQQSLELKNKALEVAEEQNETLWEVIERDRARVQAERHAYQRAAAEAENAARTMAVEAIERE